VIDNGEETAKRTADRVVAALPSLAVELRGDRALQVSVAARVP
jgi:hypothetical protein